MGQKAKKPGINSCRWGRGVICGDYTSKKNTNIESHTEFITVEVSIWKRTSEQKIKPVRMSKDRKSPRGRMVQARLAV